MIQSVAARIKHTSHDNHVTSDVISMSFDELSKHRVYPENTSINYVCFQFSNGPPCITLLSRSLPPDGEQEERQSLSLYAWRLLVNTKQFQWCWFTLMDNVVKCFAYWAELHSCYLTLKHKLVHSSPLKILSVFSRWLNTMCELGVLQEGPVKASVTVTKGNTAPQLRQTR